MGFLVAVTTIRKLRYIEAQRKSCCYMAKIVVEFGVLGEEEAARTSS